MCLKSRRQKDEKQVHLFGIFFGLIIASCHSFEWGTVMLLERGFARLARTRRYVCNQSRNRSGFQLLTSSSSSSRIRSEHECHRKQRHSQFDSLSLRSKLISIITNGVAHPNSDRRQQQHPASPLKDRRNSQRRDSASPCDEVIATR